MKRLANPAAIAAIAAISATLAAAAAPQTDDLRRYAATAPLTVAAGEGLQRLTLPWPVLQASRTPGLADLRIFDTQGQPVPIAWAAPPQAAEQRRRLGVPRFIWPGVPTSTAASGPALQLRLATGGAVLEVLGPGGRAAPPADARGLARIWLLDLTAVPADGAERLKRVHLDWPRRATGHDLRVVVEASDDGRQWLTTAETRLLDLGPASAPASTGTLAVSEGQVLRLNAVDWPESAPPRPRYLRLRFTEPLALASAELELGRATDAAPDPREPVRFEPVAAAGGHAAFWQLDLQGAIAPRALLLRLPEVNSQLQLRLEQRGDERDIWRPVARFTAWRLLRDGQDRSAAPLPLPQAAPARWWRLLADGPVPESLQSRPLEAELAWQPPRLVLLARGNRAQAQFQLAVGREKAPSVAQPLASLIPDYKPGAEHALPEARLGPLTARPLPGWFERMATADEATQRRWVLWAVLGAAVLGLALLARKLLGQLTPPP